MVYRDSEKSKAYRKQYNRLPETRRRQKQNHLKKTYNLDYFVYLRMLEEQDNKCKICKREEQLYVDHNHETGEIRGLLCLKCNTGLGMFDDNLNRVEEAVTYLKGI